MSEIVSPTLLLAFMVRIGTNLPLPLNLYP